MATKVHVLIPGLRDAQGDETFAVTSGWGDVVSMSGLDAAWQKQNFESRDVLDLKGWAARHGFETWSEEVELEVTPDFRPAQRTAARRSR